MRREHARLKGDSNLGEEGFLHGVHDLLAIGPHQPPEEGHSLQPPFVHLLGDGLLQAGGQLLHDG